MKQCKLAEADSLTMTPLSSDSSSHTFANQVQNKIPCLYLTEAVQCHSAKDTKRTGSKRRVRTKIVATDKINPHFQELIRNAVPFSVTEKIDGTCCMVRNQMLYKRRDRRLTKPATALVDQYFNGLHTEQNNATPHINIHEHFQKMPQEWIMSDGATHNFDSDGNMIKIERHCIGWTPVTQKDPQDKWHADAIDWDSNTARIIVQSSNIQTSTNQNADQYSDEMKESFTVQDVPLAQLEGKSLELVGRKIQGNIYGLKGKHCFIVHGSITIPSSRLFADGTQAAEILSFFERDSLRKWFEKERAMEGFVIHFKTGEMFKVHRHHLGMQWPLKDKGAAVLNVQDVA